MEAANHRLTLVIRNYEKNRSFGSRRYNKTNTWNIPIKSLFSDFFGGCLQPSHDQTLPALPDTTHARGAHATSWAGSSREWWTLQETTLSGPARSGSTRGQECCNPRSNYSSEMLTDLAICTPRVWRCLKYQVPRCLKSLMMFDMLQHQHLNGFASPVTWQTAFCKALVLQHNRTICYNLISHDKNIQEQFNVAASLWHVWSCER